MQDVYDFIIVGAGSAGCVLADRLTESGKYSVLLLESGGTHRRFFVNMPLGYGQTFFDRSLNWGYLTEPDPKLGGRADYWPRGKILGGSSSINAMVYIRGQREDYDDWARLGNSGWSYDEVLPYFKKSEDNDLGADQFHGAGGPLLVSGIKEREHSVVKAALASAQNLQYPLNEDFNGATQEGAGLYQFTMRNGRRSSTATAFLDRARQRKSLEVRTWCQVRRILVENRSAKGVVYRCDGQELTARAKREVLVAAGAINSPALLQHSGIGPGGLLQSLGLDVKLDLPGVGQNLQDHVQCGLAFRMRVPTVNDRIGPWPSRLVSGLQYLLARKGPLALSINQGGAFLRTRPDLPRPDTQLYFLPMSFRQKRPAPNAPLLVDDFSGMAINVSPCRPESRGRVEIKSPDPEAPPAIHPNFLATDDDRRVIVASLAIAQRISQAAPLSDLIEERARPIGPEHLGEADLEQHALATCRTTFHASGTCAMGPANSLAVVDPSLRVHGMEALRVIDASIMPLIVSGNTNAPTIMIAEKAADTILKSHS